MSEKSRTVPEQAVELRPCPFCGSPASIEESPQGSSVNPSAVEFSVGCDSRDEVLCMGYQSLTTFPRRSEAIAAWNTRAPSLVGVEREDVARCAECDAPHPWHDSRCAALPHTGQPQEANKDLMGRLHGWQGVLQTDTSLSFSKATALADLLADLDAEICRLSAAPASPRAEGEEVAWCVFCKKEHVGGATCMGHYP